MQKKSNVVVAMAGAVATMATLASAQAAPVEVSTAFQVMMAAANNGIALHDGNKVAVPGEND